MGLNDLLARIPPTRPGGNSLHKTPTKLDTVSAESCTNCATEVPVPTRCVLMVVWHVESNLTKKPAYAMSHAWIEGVV